ncbi:MAG TPA: nuclear transport factor 2 family protein [Methyloceanibacter sp.]|nr:nuclear transport factor 2 family protein [Methyloceanibacter sp.]
MRTLLAAFSFLILTGVAACTQDDVATIEAVDNVVARLDEAFEAQNAAAIKALMTADHLAVTPYYGTPQTVDELIASLPDLKYEQTNLSEPKVALLGRDVAMRTLTAKLDGTYKGTPFAHKVFITAIVVRQGGTWLERFYQVTRLAP